MNSLSKHGTSMLQEESRELRHPPYFLSGMTGEPCMCIVRAGRHDAQDHP